MTLLSFEGMTSADIDAMMAAMREAKTKAKGAEDARYAEMGRDLVEALVTELGVAESPSSTRVGRSTSSLAIEIDGRPYTFYVSIKDVKASEAREKAVEDGTLVLKKAKKKADTEEEAPAPDAVPVDTTPTDS